MIPTRYVLAGLLIFSAPALAGDEGAAENSVPVLGSNVVARIGDFDVPYDWFLHEFRSTFFRHTDATNVREAVFGPFLERMTLYTLARQDGAAGRDDLRARIDERIGGMRAFMEYQLAMTEVSMVVEAYLASKGLTPATVTVSDEEMQGFFDARIKGQPGAPARLEDVPAEIQEQIRQNLSLESFSRLVSRSLDEWKTNLPVRVHRELLEAVPLPAMEGAPPEWAP